MAKMCYFTNSCYSYESLSLAEKKKKVEGIGSPVLYHCVEAVILVEKQCLFLSCQSQPTDDIWSSELLKIIEASEEVEKTDPQN